MTTKLAPAAPPVERFFNSVSWKRDAPHRPGVCLGRLRRDVGDLDIGGHTIGRIAMEDIPAHRIVQLLPDNRQVVLARPTKGDRLAVAGDTDTELGEVVTLCVSGTEEIEAAEPIERGEAIAAGQDGRAVPARGEPGSTIDIVGFALGNAAPGDRVLVLLSPGRLYP